MPMELSRMDKQFIVIMIVGIIIFIVTGLGILAYLDWKIKL